MRTAHPSRRARPIAAAPPPSAESAVRAAGRRLSPLLGLVLSGALTLAGLWLWGPPAAPASAAVAGSVYTALAPTRILDTRSTEQTLGPGATLSLPVTGAFGSVTVPADATAVALNVTAVDETAGSYLSVYPAGGSVGTSNLNWSRGETIANLVVTEVGTDGEVSFFNALGDTDLVVDLEGYFAPDGGGPSAVGGFVPLSPTRICDTRAEEQSQVDDQCTGHTLGQGQTLTVQVSGQGGVPSNGTVAAVVANVTVTDASAASYLTVFPEGGQPPLASNLNWGPGDTLANRVIVPLGASGQVGLFNDLGSADVIVDVDGYIAGSTTSGDPTGISLFYPVTPFRQLDTRSDAGTLSAGDPLQDQLAGSGTVPDGASAVLLNVTAVDQTGTAYIALSPGDTHATSDLNFSPSQAPVPNLVLATLSDDGTTYLYANQGYVDVVIDVFGYFQPVDGGAPGPAPCGSVSSTPDSPSLATGTSQAFTASGSCSGGTTEYEWWYGTPAWSPRWYLGQAWSSSDSYTLDTQTLGLYAGGYNVAVWISNDASYQGQLHTTPVTVTGDAEVANVVYSPQIWGMTCEEAALEMALSHEGIAVTQPDILAAEGVQDDKNGEGIGPNSVGTGDPTEHFVGDPNGDEGPTWEPGTYFGAVESAAKDLGGDVIAAGYAISPTQVYRYVAEGHPVEVWVTFDFRVDYRAEWLSNGVHSWIWAGPDEHVVTIVGVSSSAVEIDNPWDVGSYGAAYWGEDQWVPMSTFQAVYALYDDQAVVLN